MNKSFIFIALLLLISPWADTKENTNYFDPAFVLLLIDIYNMEYKYVHERKAFKMMRKAQHSLSFMTHPAMCKSNLYEQDSKSNPNF